MAFGRLLVLPLVAAAVALGACGGSAAQPPAGPVSTQPARAPQLLTARHHQRTFRLTRGRAVELRLARGAELRSSGRSVVLSRLDFLVDPGYAAWELSAAAPGRTVVMGRSGGMPFRLTLVVPA